MNIGVILPTMDLWGGVKRFLELGNRFVDAGHSCTIFTPQGTPPTWFAFKGTIAKTSEVGSRDLDALFITETIFLKDMLSSRARKKIFYHVGIGEDLRPVLKHPEVLILANSSFVYDYDVKHYRIRPRKAFGGVMLPKDETEGRKSEDRFTVITYGRLGRKRTGTAIVVKACERLHRKYKNIFLLLYDTPLSPAGEKRIRDFTCKVPFEFVTNHSVERNHELFGRADAFAGAEKNGGWSNCTAEAMAAGIPVVATRAGAIDFLVNGVTGLLVWRNSVSIARGLEKLHRDAHLRARLATAGRERIREFAWEPLAKKIIAFLEQEQCD